jgi:transmembrane sensor
MQLEKLLGIIKRYLLGTASAREKKAVDDWYDAAEIDQPVTLVSQEKLAETKEQSYHNIVREIGLDKPVIPFYKRKIFRAAAVIMLLAGIGYFSFFINNKPTATSTAQHTDAPTRDVAAPKVNKAVLTLANGEKIILDSTGNGTLAMQGNVSVVKKESGLIEYEGENIETAFNTLTNPRGSRPLKLSLADGSIVWLNVASTITYPVSFTGKERMVEIDGEAYFEVAKNERMPFIVKKTNSDVQVKVLGTHFNINAYDDEQEIKVTLLEGSVQAFSGVQSTILQPGAQAVLTPNTKPGTRNPDLEEVMAWKDGRFYFEGADMKTIMRQLEKWYDVNIRYDADIKYSFVAKISRDVNISEILKIFESTDLVHFTIENKTIIIMK